MDKGAVTQPCSSPTAQTPVYKKWWLWTIVGLVVAGGPSAWGWFDPASGSATSALSIDLTWK